jgi:hypothetical protein
MRGIAPKARNAPSHWPPGGGRPQRGDRQLARQQGARGLLDAQFQQEEARREAQKAHDQQEQDRVAEGDHAGRALRDVGRDAQLIEGDRG